MSRAETVYQNQLINRLYQRFPGCVVIKNDASDIQGIPDLLVLFHHMWAMLEVKASATAPHRPNQEHYVNEFERMSFGAFIYPENEELVLRDLQSAFGLSR